MEWSNETTLKFIEDYKLNSVLWNTFDEDYKNVKIKKEILIKLGNKYLLDLADVKAKIKTIRSSFHREHRRLAKAGPNGNKKRWFAYSAMLFLLGLEEEEINSVKEISNNEEQEIEFKFAAGEDEDEDYPVIDTQLTERNPFELCENKEAQNHEGVFSVAKASKRQKTSEIPSEDALIVLKHFATKDEFSIYGEHVANELRKLSPRTQIIVKHKINNVLFEAGMGHYDQQEQS